MSCVCRSRETPKQAATPDALEAKDVPPAAVGTAEAAPAEARDLHSSREMHFEKLLGGSERARSSCTCQGRSHCRGLRCRDQLLECPNKAKYDKGTVWVH